MSFLSNIVHSVENVVKNVTQTIANPVNTIKNSFLFGSEGGQATAAIVGPNATPKQAAIITGAGVAAIYGGSAVLGPNLGVAGAAAVTAPTVLGATGAVATPSLAAGTFYSGSEVLAGSTLPATTGAINTSLFDSASNYFGLGKALSYLSNPGAASPSGGTTTTTVDNSGAAAQPTVINWKWVLGLGIGGLVLWLLISKH